MMTITTVSSSELNRNPSDAKKATRHGAVFITNRSKPSHVLLSIEDYQELSRLKPNIVELLVMPESADVEDVFS